MPKGTRHAVYDLKYHLVWTPKYRKSLLLGALEKRLKELFYEIAEEHKFDIMEMELMPDQVHLFVSAVQKWSPGKIVSTFKAISFKIIFEEFSKSMKSFMAVIFGAPATTLAA